MCNQLIQKENEIQSIIIEIQNAEYGSEKFKRLSAKLDKAKENYDNLILDYFKNRI